MDENGIEIFADASTQNICEYIDKTKPDELAEWVYAIEYSSRVKIGRTSNIASRIPALRAQARYGGMSIGRLLLSKPCANSVELESVCHRHFSKYRIDGTELFEIALDDVIPFFSSLTYDTDFEKLKRQRDIMMKSLMSLVTGGLNEQLSAETDMSNASPEDCFLKLYELFQGQTKTIESLFDRVKRLTNESELLFEYCAEWKKRYEAAMRFINDNVVKNRAQEYD